MLNVGPVEFEGYVLVDKFLDNLYISNLELIQIIIFLLFLFLRLFLVFLLTLLIFCLFVLTQPIDKIDKQANLMIRNYGQIFNNLIPMIFINVQKSIVRYKDKCRIEWTYLLKNNCLE